MLRETLLIKGTENFKTKEPFGSTILLTRAKIFMGPQSGGVNHSLADSYAGFNVYKGMIELIECIRAQSAVVNHLMTTSRHNHRD